METCARRLRIPAISLILAACVLLPSHVTVSASDPHGAYYSSDTNKVFWFIHASDLHVGTSESTDLANFQWLVTTARDVIRPSFIVATGDLTDSTNGNWLNYPNGPYQAEWDQYKAIIDAARGPDDWMDFFYDLPGNHDAYNDQDFSYYLANSVQGRATGKTQLSWTRTFPFGKYHFLGVNSADNTGAAFSIFPPYGDYAGLDTSELAFVNQQLTAQADASLTFVFGHHPVTSTGSSTDTYLYYGQQEFVHYLDQYRASTYNYGHTHANSQALFKGNSYTGLMSGDGIYYYNVASLGKDSPNTYSLVAVDCNGVSSVTTTVGTWPLVLITAPLDKYVGTAVNPYVYTVPTSSGNPIRALVFSPTSVTAVSYRVDGAAWLPMSQVATNPALWQATWDASGLAAGEHTIDVQAGATLDSIKVQLTSTVNHPPVANADSYSVQGGSTLSVPPKGVLTNDTDADTNTLTAALVTGPVYAQSFSLNSDGSFTYVPATNYVGTDTFTYRAFDGKAYSAFATVSISVTSPPAADTVTILSATYNAKRKQLSVTATSSAQPNATLTVVGFGQMTYKAKSKSYVLTATVATKPSSVTVTSTFGGRATVNLT